MVSGGDLEKGALAMTSRWSLFGNYDVSVEYTVTTLSIRKIKLFYIKQDSGKIYGYWEWKLQPLTPKYLGLRVKILPVLPEL